MKKKIAITFHPMGSHKTLWDNVAAINILETSTNEVTPNFTDKDVEFLEIQGNRPQDLMHGIASSWLSCGQARRKETIEATSLWNTFLGGRSSPLKLSWTAVYGGMLKSDITKLIQALIKARTPATRVKKSVLERRTRSIN